jgi:hypothetical protein
MEFHTPSKELIIVRNITVVWDDAVYSCTYVSTYGLTLMPLYRVSAMKHPHFGDGLKVGKCVSPGVRGLLRATV